MALRKEPDRRYASPADLAADLDRHRSGLPVTAREDGLLYRAGKLVRRHRLAVAAVAAVGISLVTGLGAALWQAREARLEAKKAAEVKDFLVRIFEVADPGESRGREVTARELLDQSVGRIETLRTEPEVQADLLAVAGVSYRNLGLYATARPLLERSLRLQRRLHGEKSLATADAEFSLALLLAKQGASARSLALHRSALATRQALLTGDDVRVADSLVALAVAALDRDHDDEAAGLLREALAIRRKRSGPFHPQVGSILGFLGMVSHRAGDLESAERLYRESLSIKRRALGPLHPEVATSLHNLAALQRRRGHLKDAEAMFRQVLVLEGKLYGKGHPTTADTWGYLGHTLRDEGDLTGAEAAYRQALVINAAGRGASHAATTRARYNLGKLLLLAGRPAEAEPFLREAADRYQATEGPDHSRTRDAAQALAECRAALRGLTE